MLNLNFNNNHTFHFSSSSLSLSSISSTLLDNTFQINNSIHQNSCKQTDSLSSLSPTSSITIILHALHTTRNKPHRKKFFKKNPYSYYRNNHGSSSSSNESISLRNQIDNGLNTNRSRGDRINSKILVENNFFDETYSIDKKQSHQIFEEKKTTSSFILTETDDDENRENFNCHQSTQTNNYSSIRQQYPYGNLRRVNSNLLDYIFIPISDPCNSNMYF